MAKEQFNFIDIMLEKGVSGKDERETAFSLINRAAKGKMKDDAINLVAKRFAFQPAAVRKWYEWRLKTGGKAPGMTWDETKKQYTWVGNVKDLVSTVGNGDARLGFVEDAASGAKIAMNISGTDEPAEEPFYIEAPDGENMYDAYNRKEAVQILSNIRKGEKYPDMPAPKKKKSVRKSHKSSPSGFGGMR